MSERRRFAGNPPGFYLENLREQEAEARKLLDFDVDEETRSELVYLQRMIEGAAIRACVAMLREVLGC